MLCSKMCIIQKKWNIQLNCIIIIYVYDCNDRYTCTGTRLTNVRFETNCHYTHTHTYGICTYMPIYNKTVLVIVLSCLYDVIGLTRLILNSLFNKRVCGCTYKPSLMAHVYIGNIIIHKSFHNIKIHTYTYISVASPNLQPLGTHSGCFSFHFFFFTPKIHGRTFSEIFH